MARTVQEIYDAMVVEKNSNLTLSGLQPNIDSAQTLLSDLTSTSKVAIWRLLFFTMAIAIWTHEKIFDLFREEIEETGANLITGTARWYHAESFKYQHGDPLVWDGKKYIYDTIDSSKQIIQRAAVADAGWQLRIKVAKLDQDELPIPLDTGEKAGFENYIRQIKFAGTNTSIINENADLLHLDYLIHYDPLVLASNGTLIADPAVEPVKDAINNYIQNLPFDGVLYLSELTDHVQAAEGVVNPVLQDAFGTFGEPSLTSFLGAGKYKSDAGYMTLSAGTIFTYAPFNE